MAWICKEEGIEADAEALAILAAAGEGSVRDSLSALDQAIACCGSKLNAADVRALLGAFSIESLEKVTQALAGSDSRQMLEVVDELERNGHNLQHFSRELARYFRNLLVARITGGESARLIAASAAQRARLAEIAGKFSEEDLTRYLQLTLDLFKDLQVSLQPRFHLEIGLVRLVQAGKLLPIEQALAQVGQAPGNGPAIPAGRPAHAPAPQAVPMRAPAPPPPVRTGPSPFELDRAKKAGARPPEQSSAGSGAAPQVASQPVAVGDWRQKIHAALMELGMPFTADAVENASIVEANGELQFTATKADSLALSADDLNKAIRQIAGCPMRVKVIIGEAAAPAAPMAKMKPPAADEDEVAKRALDNPEVQRFREVFGGEVRKVRNLKE
jgi:DNA polymerase-3 subunit gamma/tau